MVWALYTDHWLDEITEPAPDHGFGKRRVKVPVCLEKKMFVIWWNIAWCSLPQHLSDVGILGRRCLTISVTFQNWQIWHRHPIRSVTLRPVVRRWESKHGFKLTQWFLTLFMHINECEKRRLPMPQRECACDCFCREASHLRWTLPVSCQYCIFSKQIQSLAGALGYTQKISASIQRGLSQPDRRKPFVII